MQGDQAQQHSSAHHEKGPTEERKHHPASDEEEQQEYWFPDQPKAVELVNLAIVTTQHALRFLQKSHTSHTATAAAQNEDNTTSRYPRHKQTNTKSRERDAARPQQHEQKITSTPSAVSALGSVPAVLQSALYQVQELARTARLCHRDLQHSRSVIQELVEVTGSQRETIKEQHETHNKIQKQKDDYKALVKELRQKLEDNDRKCRALQNERQNLLKTIHELAQDSRRKSSEREKRNTEEKQKIQNEPTRPSSFEQDYLRQIDKLKQDLIKCQGENRMLRHRNERQKRIMQHLDNMCLSHKHYIAQLTARPPPTSGPPHNTHSNYSGYSTPSTSTVTTSAEPPANENEQKNGGGYQGIAAGHRRLVVPMNDKSPHHMRPPKPPHPKKFSQVEIDDSIGSWVNEALQPENREEVEMEQYAEDEYNETQYDIDDHVIEDDENDYFEEESFDEQSDQAEEDNADADECGEEDDVEPLDEEGQADGRNEFGAGAAYNDEIERHLEGEDMYSYENVMYEDDDEELERIKQEVRQQFDGSSSCSLETSGELGSADVFATVGTPSTGTSGYVASVSDSSPPASKTEATGAPST